MIRTYQEEVSNSADINLSNQANAYYNSMRSFLLPETDLQKTAEVAERLREAVASTDVVLEAGLPLHFTISIGVATLNEKSINLDTLFTLADQALYQAKASGRNKVGVADQDNFRSSAD
jgi:predicted signal transduction protein with EAL and GGDEF domain